MRYAFALVALAISMTVLSWAPPAPADDKSIHLDNAWARRAGGGHGGAGMAMNGAVYVKIANHGKAPDALVSAATDAAEKVELHATINDGGVMRMRPQARIEVGAGKALEMKPGGYHIMLLGLTRDLKPGETVKLTLTFEKAGPMAIEAPVK
jgi:periplasmic copper chaperone A